MSRLSPARRLLLAALAIVQMAVPVLAVVADAQLTADSAGAPLVHIEDHTQKQCRPVHPDDCALCQLLSHFSAPRSSGPAVPSESCTRFSVRDPGTLSLTSVARAIQRTRAPPVSLS